MFCTTFESIWTRVCACRNLPRSKHSSCAYIFKYSILGLRPDKCGKSERENYAKPFFFLLTPCLCCRLHKTSIDGKNKLKLLHFLSDLFINVIPKLSETLNFLIFCPPCLKSLRRSIHSLHAYTFKILRKSPANKKSKGRLDSISYGTNLVCCSVLCPMFFAVNLLFAHSL